MRSGAIVAILTVGVAAGGLYLYRALAREPATGPSSATAPPPAAAPTAAPSPATPSPAAPPRRSDLTRDTAPAVAERPAAPTEATLPAGVPGPRLDLLPGGIVAPGTTEPSLRNADLAAPAEASLAPELAEALAAARQAFRDGDAATARSLATKIVAAAPDNSAARRLLVSSACKLGDAAAARAAVAELPAHERPAFERYCRTQRVELTDGSP